MLPFATAVLTFLFRGSAAVARLLSIVGCLLLLAAAAALMSAVWRDGVLAAQMGPATPVPAVAAHVVCSGCGGREVATRPAWPPRGPVSRHSPTPAGGGDGDVEARNAIGAPPTGDDPA